MQAHPSLASEDPAARKLNALLAEVSMKKASAVTRRDTLHDE
jgi:hypothetical protein